MQDATAFRQAISHFASGVTVVTTTTGDGRAGMTASAVASVSLDPTLLLVCISNRIPTHHALEHSTRFAVSVLGEGHEELARRFASPAEDRFAGVPLRDEHDPPVLAGAVAWFRCDLRERFPGGDHSIFIGEVVECGAHAGARPLVYFRSGFGTFENPAEAMSRDLRPWEFSL